MATTTGQTYRFECKRDNETTWHPIGETTVRRMLAKETPDREMLDLIIEDMKATGAEANDAELTFRAVPAGPTAPPDWRVAWTTAPADYDGWGTVTLDAEAGTTDRGQVIRKVLIDPRHWDWHMQRYGSGNYVGLSEAELPRFRSFWTMRPDN